MNNFFGLKPTDFISISDTPKPTSTEIVVLSFLNDALSNAGQTQNQTTFTLDRLNSFFGLNNETYTVPQQINKTQPTPIETEI